MQRIYTRLVSSVLFPLHERVKRHSTVAVRRAMEQSQWWSRERLEALRAERLRALLQSAQQHVPYYRTRFRELGFDAQDACDTAVLERLPLLSKADVRANLELMKSERAEELSRFNTGGSSGEPLIFFIGRERISHDVAAKWRATRWWGVDIGDREIVVWGSPIELGAQDRMRALRDRLLRTRLLPAFEMSRANLDKFVAAIRNARPAMLFGYPSSLALIARHAEQSGVRMDDLGILVAFVTAEKLYDEQRGAISRVFGCAVANGYGGRDAGFIAHECPSGGMHITAEDVIVETVRPNGTPAAAGEPGEIVVTHLATRDFPFIRYRTGDIGVLDDRPCPCGRGLPLLDEIQGRATDFVVAADGTVMHGLALIYVLRDISGIASFKIIQESLDRTRVQVVPGPEHSEAIRGTIKRGLKARLGNSVQIEVEEVSHIAPEASGKFRYVVSRVGTR
ncbi:MAG: phenylacetate--CoA ligase family protein [Burkholderiales bacterium]|nr:phenylacetate--CoA ligase family protein [Burkholderiales bacterium]